ncbi:MAG TPA: ABC transporter ATP-binding protein [Candidatus Methylacidiphilales bacterium]|nr:ABC transporter ATP-binding protein [Candidatus Methylacidiphilales bacterium]
MSNLPASGASGSKPTALTPPSTSGTSATTTTTAVSTPGAPASASGATGTTAAPPLSAPREVYNPALKLGGAALPQGGQDVTVRLWAEGLAKTYTIGSSKLEVLRGLDVDFPASLSCVIQGQSGSGKSTLLHVLGGLDHPDQGRVMWRGESIYGWSRNKLAEWRNLNVGFIFQSYQLLPELTAWENVDIPAMLARKGSRKKAEELLEMVGLKGRATHMPRQMSGGEQQRVAIARALRNDPQLLLADEPTGNLDPKTGREIVHLLLALQREKQKTLILVTHDESVAAMGHFRFHMRDGQLVT